MLQEAGQVWLDRSMPLTTALPPGQSMAGGVPPSQVSKKSPGRLTVPRPVQPALQGHEVQAFAPLQSAVNSPCAPTESTSQTTNWGAPPSVGKTLPVMMPLSVS